MMDSAGIFFVLLFAGPFLLFLYGYYSRSRELLEVWAKQNGFRLLQSERRCLLRGPFLWGSSKNQTVYRVKIRDEAGRIRSGWVRCGGWCLGLFSDQVEVRWDS